MRFGYVEHGTSLVCYVNGLLWFYWTWPLLSFSLLSLTEGLGAVVFLTFCGGCMSLRIMVVVWNFAALGCIDLAILKNVVQLGNLVLKN